MRKIKFRVWNGLEMIYPQDERGIDLIFNKVIGWSVQNEEGDCLAIQDHMKKFRDVSLNDNVIMQYVGLRDSNNQEIYEGDIIVLSNTDPDSYGVVKGVVVFYDYGFAVKPITKCPFEYASVGVIEDQGVSGKVIGNIFENPYLLEEKNER